MKGPFLTILACGWLLLEPPITEMQDGTLTMTTSRPFIEWSYINAYDTAKECRSGKEQYEAFRRKNPGQSPELFVNLALASRCIPSDALNWR